MTTAEYPNFSTLQLWFAIRKLFKNIKREHQEGGEYDESFALPNNYRLQVTRTGNSSCLSPKFFVRYTDISRHRYTASIIDVHGNVINQVVCMGNTASPWKMALILSNPPDYI